MGGQPEPAEPWNMTAFGGEPGADGECCMHCCLGAREEASGWPRIRRLQSIHGSSRSAPPAARRVFLSDVYRAHEAPALGMRTGQAAGTLLAARAAGAKHPAFSILNPDRCRPRYLCPGRRMAPSACWWSGAECERV